MNLRQRLTLFQFAAGASDTCTGLLLLFAPAWTMHLLHIAQPPQPISFAGFVGAFVFAVGISYLWVGARHPLGSAGATAWTGQWLTTALARSSVALFLFVQIATRRMEVAWLGVAVFDAALAVLQWIGLHKRWIDRA